MLNIINITTETYPPKVFYGYEEGLKLRKELNLDEFDKSQESCIINLDPNIFHMSTTFMFGLFTNSIVYFKTKELFFKHYDFKTDYTHLYSNLNRVIDRVLDNQFSR